MEHEEKGSAADSSVELKTQDDAPEKHETVATKITADQETTGTVADQEKTTSGTDSQCSDHTLPTEGAAELELARTKSTTESIKYPTGPKLWLIMLALCLAVLCFALDNSIIATAIPHITDEFDSLDDVGWYGSSYMLTTACFQLFFGKLYSFFSIKHVFTAAIAMFEIGSAVCGSAPNSIALILGRAIAGVGAAGIFSGALIIVAHSIPLQKRPMYTGLIGAMFGIASVSGPLLGGVFTDSSASWRWCFYINLPFGGFTMVVLMFFFTPPRETAANDTPWRERLKQFDLEGTALLMPAIVCFLLALQWGGVTYPWSNWRIILLFVIFGVLIVSFLGVQVWKKDLATVPLRILKQRSIWSSCLFSFCTAAGFFILVYYLPIWFQGVKGTSAVRSGIMILPLMISLVIFSIVAGILVTVIGYYAPFVIIGTMIGTVGVGLITTFHPYTSSSHWIGYQIITGAGMGMAMQQPMIAVQTVLHIRDVPTGTVVLVFIQTLGGAIFISVAESVFRTRLLSNVKKDVPSINPYIVVNTGATEIQSSTPPRLLASVTRAYNDSLTTTYYVAVAMICAAIIPALFIEWKSVKAKQSSGKKVAESAVPVEPAV